MRVAIVAVVWQSITVAVHLKEMDVMRRMLQRREHLLDSLVPIRDVIFYDRDLARETALVA